MTNFKKYRHRESGEIVEARNYCGTSMKINYISRPKVVFRYQPTTTYRIIDIIEFNEQFEEVKENE